MTALSITTAWNEAMAFVRREFGTLLAIVLGLIALPVVALQLLVPGFNPQAGQEPELNAWMLLIIPAALIGMVGSLVISILAIGREPVVRDAFSLAFRRLLPLIGAALLLMCILLPFGLVMAVLWALSPGLAAHGIVLFVLGAIFVWVRLMVINPVAAAEDVGPFDILRRSWELTRGHFWKLLGFMILLIILFVVVAFAVSAVVGILIFVVAGAPDPGSTAHVLMVLVGGLINSVLTLILTVVIARVYAQLAGQPTSGT